MSQADELRPAVFVPDDESLVGSPETLRLKRRYINYLWAGDSEDEAAARILTPSQVIALWKRQDAVFRTRVEETLALFEHETLRRLEENLIEQAQFPNPQGAALALRVLERRKPEKWAKQSTTNIKVEVAGDAADHLSELLDDPVAIEGQFRELPSGENDEQQLQEEDHQE